MDIRQLSENLFVGPQINPNDLAALARQGFTDVICNRPDNEHSKDASSAKMNALASELGLTFHYLPITPNEPFNQQAQALASLVAQGDKKLFAYCRSGARSSNAWSFAREHISAATEQKN